MSVHPAWHEVVRDTLKANSVRLVTYVPDNVLKPLIKAAHEDSYFTTFPTTREEEAVGIVAGASQNDVDLYWQIQLRPRVDFSSLQSVLVLIPKTRK